MFKQVVGALEDFIRKTKVYAGANTMEFFVALVSSFQTLTNSTKNPGIGAMGVLSVSLEYYGYSKICEANQIKHCRTADCNFSKDILFHRLINYLHHSSDFICIS